MTSRRPSRTRRKPVVRVRRPGLRQRLQEAEDTIAAIRDGHVEALIINAPEGEQVYTLRSADQLYRLIVEQMREGALTIDDRGTILYCNRRFSELVATPPERTTGRRFGEFVVPEEAERVADLLSTDADARRQELHLQTALGAAIPVQISSTALLIDNVRTRALIITDLAPERIERSLRESNRLKDEFLATLSHELRTPLNVILGWTRLLLASRLSPTAQHQAIELIDRNAQAQTQLVNDLVDMSRLTTGKMRLELEPVALVPLLEESLEGIRPAAQAKDVALEVAWHVSDINVSADRTRLQQVLWNLLSNAIKFTPRGGRIGLSAAADADRVRIVVSDSGVGIEPSFLPHVFDRFRQADSTSTRSYGGLGLGLAIVRDLVHLHGGEVGVESAGRGSGATFTVTLRRSKGTAGFVERRHRLREAASLRGHSILLVEDHDDSRDLLTQTLKNSGAAVASFAGAEEAFQALDRVRPSVIVADIGLPGQDGYSFIRRVRAHSAPAIQSVPAIAVTAYATGSDRIEALAVGFQRHLAKPLDPGLLVQAIHDLTRRSLE